jgi:hypothetical protein
MEHKSRYFLGRNISLPASIMYIYLSDSMHVIYVAEPFLRSRQLRSYSRISRHFMEPEGSLPCWKKPFPGPCPKLDQYCPYYLILSLRFSLILSSHLRLDLSSSLFPSGFPTNILYAFLLSNACYMPYRSHPPWLDHSNYTWGRVQVMKLLIMQFSPTSCHFTSLRSKYSPQHPVYLPPLMSETLYIYKMSCNFCQICKHWDKVVTNISMWSSNMKLWNTCTSNSGSSFCLYH